MPDSTFLRRVLILDAVSSAAMGALLLLAMTPLTSLFGLSRPLLLWTGLSLLPFAAFVGWLATRELPPRAAVWAVVVLNAFWAVDSLLLLVAGWIEPTPLGAVFVVFQALFVGGLAALQLAGLRRIRLALA
ncbi:MAG TPA: hypothetical protein VF789_14870 [Thermoanaerobaculia bacterium]